MSASARELMHFVCGATHSVARVPHASPGKIARYDINVPALWRSFRVRCAVGSPMGSRSTRESGYEDLNDNGALRIPATACVRQSDRLAVQLSLCRGNGVAEMFT